MTSTSTAARRSKRIVASESPEPDDDEMQDGEGDEEEDAQGEPDDEYEDMDIDEDDDELPAEIDELDEDDPVPASPLPLATPTSNARKTRRASSSAASASKNQIEPRPTPGTGIKLRLKVGGNGTGNSSQQPSNPTLPPPAVSAATRTRPARTLSHNKQRADTAIEDPPVTRGSRGKRSIAEVEQEADELASDSQDSDSVSVSASASQSKKKQKGKARKSALGADASGSDGFSDEEEFMTKGKTVERMTARQRSKHDSAFAEELMVLPEDNSKKAILTEDEKVRRKEEVARRRKLQADQKQENDKREAIDRLLKAQAGRSRNKDLPASRDASTPANGASTMPEAPPPPPHLIRYMSTIRNGTFEMCLAVPAEKESILLDLFERNAYGLAGTSGGEVKETNNSPLPSRPLCGVTGCTMPRKYRCVQNFEVGGCSMAHLKQLELR